MTACVSQMTAWLHVTLLFSRTEQPSSMTLRVIGVEKTVGDTEDRTPRVIQYPGSRDSCAFQ